MALNFIKQKKQRGRIEKPDDSWYTQHRITKGKAFFMEQEKIDRINFLARKAKSPEGLTPEETEERAQLRAEYIEAFRCDLRSQLENTYLVDEKGNKRKLSAKGKK